MNNNQFSSMKILCHADKVSRYQANQTPYPVSVDLSPSNCCNHGCVWCVYSGFLKESREILDRDTLIQLIDDLSDVNVRGINFTGGGEPLTNKSTVDAMEKAHSLGMDVGLITNGGLLSEEIIRRLKPICRYIRISLDAGTAQTYSKLHGVNMDEFEKVMSMISMLGRLNGETNCRTGVQLLQVKENKEETLSVIKRLKDYGIDFVEIRPVGSMDRDYKEGMTADESYFNTLEQVGDECFKVVIRRERFNDYMGHGKDYKKCVSPHFITAFGADGLVYTCCEFLGSKDHVLGNFKEEKLEDIFEFNRVEKKLASLNLDHCPKYCKAEMINRIFNQLDGVTHRNIL